MAARATRSASRKARLTEAVATGPLGALRHDELGVIFEGLADPLQPVVAVALSSTCLGLRTPLRPALEGLKERHARAVALCEKMEMSCAELRDDAMMDWGDAGLTADDMATLGMLLSKWLPRLQRLWLHRNRYGDAAMQALCEALGPGSAPSLHILMLDGNQFGPAGAEALAAALGRGALPQLEGLYLDQCPIGNQGVAALAAPLRTLPALNEISLSSCEIGDEGVASLVDNLGKDDFKKLEMLAFQNNKITDTGAATLVAAVDGTGLPALMELLWSGNPCSEVASKAVYDASRRAKARAGGGWRVPQV